MRRRINEDVSNEPVDFPKNLIPIPDCVSPIIETAYTKNKTCDICFFLGKAREFGATVQKCTVHFDDFFSGKKLVAPTKKS